MRGIDRWSHQTHAVDAIDDDDTTRLSTVDCRLSTTMSWEELRKEARRSESACERELGELSAMGACARVIHRSIEALRVRF